MKYNYIALLRAVNVGKTWIKMADLRQMLAAEGFQTVETYIQSGNVLFASNDAKSQCSRVIAELLEKACGTPVRVFVKNAKELAEVAAGNPFLDEPSIDPSTLHVTFLQEKPKRPTLAKLAEIHARDDRYAAVGDIIYLHCPNGYGRTKISNMALEKALEMSATTRNWKTVLTLHEMAQVR